MSSLLEHDDHDEASIVRKSLASLDVQRKAMEHEADAIYLELTTPPSEGVEAMGIDTPLVDSEGYPRGDIDLYRARSLRQRFQVLRTDHKQITKKVEGMLIQLAALQVRTLSNPPTFDSLFWKKALLPFSCIVSC